MSKQNPQASIQSLILSLFPVHPRAINEQIFNEITTTIKEIWKSTEIKILSKLQSQNNKDSVQDKLVLELFIENLQRKIESLKEARKNHFRAGGLALEWWPSPDDIYLSNRVPAFYHTFRIQKKSIEFVLNATLPENLVKRYPKKKYYLLAEEPIEQKESSIQISFQLRPLGEKEAKKFDKQPKQELINKSTLNTIKYWLDENHIQVDTESTFLETFSFHLSLFTQKNDPIILYKNILDYFTDFIDRMVINDSKDMTHSKVHISIEKNLDSTPFRQIEYLFFQEIVTLLAKFEDFLISIWSKKCFITQTDYIISLDKLVDWAGRDFVENISESILSNKKQMREWAQLYKINMDRLKLQMISSDSQESLPLDTAYFNTAFKKKLLNALPDNSFKDLLDGYVYKSDNWYALNSLQDLWRGKIKCIYIDPPYNTGNDDFLYKDNFSRFEWMVMLRNRLEVAKTYLSEDGVIIISIDDNEMSNLKLLLDELFEENLIGPIIVQTNPRGRTLDKHLAKTHEYLLIYALDKDHVNTLYKIPKNKEQLAEYNKVDDEGKVYRLIELRNRNPRFNRINRPNLYYPLYTNLISDRISLTQSDEYPIEILPKTSQNIDDCWTWSREKAHENLHLLVSKKVSTGAWRVFRRSYLDKKGESSKTKEKSIWMEGSLSNERGREQLRDLFGSHIHDYPKSVDYIERIINLATDDHHFVLDFFAGSGTTAHAIMQSNHKNQTKNKFILIEKSNQFENVILPRIKKLSYSYNWKDGSSIDKNGQGIFIQYQILEQPMEEAFTEDEMENFNEEINRTQEKKRRGGSGK